MRDTTTQSEVLNDLIAHYARVKGYDHGALTWANLRAANALADGRSVFYAYERVAKQALRDHVETAGAQGRADRGA